jgi:hypothetical protein
VKSRRIAAEPKVSAVREDAILQFLDALTVALDGGIRRMGIVDMVDELLVVIV